MVQQETPYHIKLCAEMLNYCATSNKKTDNMKGSEIRDNLLVFFTVEEIDQALNILLGR